MLRLGKQLMIFDGGMGSELEKLGLTGVPEDRNITYADPIRAVHRAYGCADFLTTDTFGLNPVKYKGKFSLREVAEAAIENARAALRTVPDGAQKKVFFDVGPTGVMLAPIGTMTFDEAYDAFAAVAEVSGGADGYIVETFSDLYELKACILALKEHSDKPIFATMTFDEKGRTLTGTTPEIMVNTLEGLGVDAVGVNCSLGPDKLIGVVERLLACATLPVIVQPNRGLPVLRDGRTVYEMTEERFEECCKKFIDDGVSIIGGCCGTTPACIERLAAYRGLPVKRRPVTPRTMLNSATRAVTIEGVTVCGERLNPTGKPALKEALKAGNFDYLADEAIRQQDAGAQVLDLNVGVPTLDEPAVMEAACRKVQEYSDLPLCIDSSDPAAVERGVRAYNGVPLINSVNGEDAVMDRIFPIAKKYGAVVLGLTMDSRGVPQTAAERVQIAQKILARAERYGIPRHKIMIDTLVLTASAEQKLVRETVEALRSVHGLGVKTALGVSNVSFGLPNRPLLNKTFLTMAMAAGLDMPIMNPLDGEMIGAVRAYGVLSGRDEQCAAYIDAYKSYTPAATQTVRTQAEAPAAIDSLYECVVRGVKEKAAELCEKELQTSAPLSVVNDVLIAALQEVGARYDAGTLFLPQLVSAAEAAKVAFATVTDRLPKGDAARRGTVVLATVKGDVHDIGKNIVKVVLESYGYPVIDLGKDTPPQTVVDAVRSARPVAVGLSALMTTTVKSMEETIALLRADGCPCPIFVGGAVLNAEVARKIGADYYTKDALELVKILQTL